jgi:hypothetical protein
MNPDNNESERNGDERCIKKTQRVGTQKQHKGHKVQKKESQKSENGERAQKVEKLQM